MRPAVHPAETNGAFQVLVDCGLPFVGKRNYFIQKRRVAGFTDIFPDRREQPERVVGAVRVVLIPLLAGQLDMPGAVIVRDQRKTGTAAYLAGNHQADFTERHLRREMQDTLNILHRVAVAVAVPQAAVDKRSRARPDEGNKALVSVPRIDHAVEIFIRRIDPQVVEFPAPICFQFVPVLLHAPQAAIGVRDSLCFALGMRAEQKTKLQAFIRLK